MDAIPAATGTILNVSRWFIKTLVILDARADAVGAPRQTVADVLKDFGEKVSENQNAKTAANHHTDFEPPIYNFYAKSSREPNA